MWVPWAREEDLSKYTCAIAPFSPSGAVLYHLLFDKKTMLPYMGEDFTGQQLFWRVYNLGAVHGGLRLSPGQFFCMAVDSQLENKKKLLSETNKSVAIA